MKLTRYMRTLVTIDDAELSLRPLYGLISFVSTCCRIFGSNCSQNNISFAGQNYGLKFTGSEVRWQKKLREKEADGRATLCFAANLCCKNVDAQSDKLATTDVPWRNRRKIGLSSDYGTKFQRDVPSFWRYSKFPHDTVYDKQINSDDKRCVENLLYPFDIGA